MYESPDRDHQIVLSEEQLEAIAERAAKKALQSIYADVGKSVVTKLLWVIGLAAIGIVLFLTGKGTIKLG